ncbi:hypothetical protein D1871_21825 [Nakamurella silvestris]|nr:hypothetical protein D1871_21825 [Nakamurella silvestris]
MKRRQDLQYFNGAIAGFGTTSGTRIVIGFWPDSPLGSFADVMMESADGHRVLLAPHEECADFVSATYNFDEIVISGVQWSISGSCWRVRAGDLTVVLELGRRGILGALLWLVPRPIARSRWWATLIDPIVRVVLPGVRTRGTAGFGRREWYSALDAHPITSIAASWQEEDLGRLVPVDPPVEFGFGSTPASPMLVRVRTTIHGG